MSKYTTEVRYICEELAGLSHSAALGQVEDIIQESWSKIFNLYFPIFDENYRPELCKKILNAYYTREIGAETVGLWKLQLNQRLNEIMPYYNQLYLSEKIKFDPLQNVDTTIHRHTHTVGNSDTDSGHDNDNDQKGKNDTDSRQIYSETPMGVLDAVEQGEYATTATFNKSNSTSTAHTDDTGTNYSYNRYMDEVNYWDTVTGKASGETYSEMLNKYRETFLNIDQMIIKDMGVCFIKLW